MNTVEGMSAVLSQEEVLELREQLRSELYRAGEGLCDLAEATSEDDQSNAALFDELKPLLSNLQGIYAKLGTTLKGCHAVATIAATACLGFVVGWLPAFDIRF